MSSEFSIVASMDILGISNAISDSEMTAKLILNNFAESAGPLLRAFRGMIPRLNYYTFSDSLFIVVPIEHNNLDTNIIRNFGQLLSGILYDCFDKDVPLCGGVSAGPVIFGAEPTGDFQSFVVGKALVEAYKAQEEWDWVGIGFAAPDNDYRQIKCREIADILVETEPPLAHKYKIPINEIDMKTCKKKRAFKEAFAISWPKVKYTEIIEKIDKYEEAAEGKSHLVKFQMTREFVDSTIVKVEEGEE